MLERGDGRYGSSAGGSTLGATGTRILFRGKVNMMLNVHRNHKAYSVRGEGGGGAGRGMEVGGEGDLYTYRYTVTTRMTSALRWAAMRAILMFHNYEGQSHKSVHRPQFLK